MIQDPTCCRNNGLETVGSCSCVTSMHNAHGVKRDAPSVGTAYVNNGLIKTVYAATVKLRIARNLRQNVIYSTRNLPSPRQSFANFVASAHVAEIALRSSRIFLEFR